MARVYKGYCMTKQVEITDDMIQKIANNAVRCPKKKLGKRYSQCIQ